MSYFRSGLSFVMVLVVLFSVSAGLIAAQDTEPVPPEEALRRDAEEYARTYGVDLEEALRRLALMGVVGGLGYQLATEQQETFGGLWIEHTPEFKVVVAFTANGQETVRSYLENSPLADLVEVREATVSLATLEATQTEVMELVRSLDIPADSEIDITEERVKLYVVDREKLDAALQERNIQLPAFVEVITVDHLATPASDSSNSDTGDQASAGATSLHLPFVMKQ